MKKKLNLDKNGLKKVCHDNDIEYIGVFGSYARDEASSTSDIDLLVRFSKRKSLFDEVDVQENFQKFFGKKVDLVTEGALHPYIKSYVQKDLITLYER